jgi:hypothetical protein
MSSSQTIKQNNAKDDNNATQYLLNDDKTGSYNNSADVTPYVTDYVVHLDSCFQVMVQNMPVTCDDIHAAEDIFGPILGH